MRANSAGGTLCLLAAAFGAAAVTPSQTAAGSFERRSGALEVIWRGGSGPEGACRPSYTLADARGGRVELLFQDRDEARPAALVGKQVTVEGVAATVAAEAFGATSFSARNIHAEPSSAVQSDTPDCARGARKLLTILCRFADSAQITPKSASYFNRLMLDPREGVAAHFQRMSYGALSFSGSRTVGWLNLPRPRSAYRPGQGFSADLALADALELAGRRVDPSEFDGINLVFNQPAFGPSVGGFGGRMTLDLAGEPRSYGVTWLCYPDQALWVHEIGHSLGLPHSSGPYRSTYDSEWDVMSSSYGRRSGRFGYVAQDTIAYHKRLLGWINDGAAARVEPGSRSRLSISGLCPSMRGCRVIEVPIAGSAGRMYTIEARFRSGADARIPGKGVLLHLVDPTRGDRTAAVVDVDRNGNPNDAAARWLPGEVFTDPASGVRIAVVSAGKTGFTVDVSNRAS